jgi:DNA repair ATPase RecN
MSEQLKQNLEELQKELKGINSENPKLQKLAADIDAAQAKPEEFPQALAHAMQHVAEEFEVEHPQLTAIVNNIMHSLSSLGI